MFYNDLWGFSINPPYFGYNSAEQENIVLRIFFVSETYPDSNWPEIFLRVNILPWEAPGGE
jgi:hypothetical protein